MAAYIKLVSFGIQASLDLSHTVF